MELVIFVGLQASGKTSFYQARFAHTHALVSKDRMPNNRNPTRRQLELVEEALRAGRSVVVDNTNARVVDRLPLVILGHALGARVVGYYFESRVEDCLERNRGRAGKARVPDAALYATRKRLEVPSYAEGFDALYFVRMAEGGWQVEEWKEVAGDEAR
jgi:predicted kinase